MPATKVQLIGGLFQDLEGNPLANGYLLLDLSQDGHITGVGQICSGIEIKITLDGNGSIVTNPVQAVWGNDQMTPANSYYRVTGYTAAGQPAWGPNNQQVFGNGGTFDTGTWVPNVPISWNPPTTGAILETNGTLNTVQTLLNLIAGSGISLTADGAGGVTIAATGGGAGAITLSSTPNTGGSGSTPVNVSTEGTLDWFVWASATEIGSGYTASQTSVHSKVQGGWIAQSLLPFGPLGSIAALDVNTTPWTWTSTLGDDTVPSLATVNANFLNALNNSIGFQSNTATLIQGGFGFRFAVPARTTTRNLNLYLFFKSGSVATNNSLVITARLQDGSIADQTLTISPGDTGSHFYKVNIQFSASANGVPLIVKVAASQASGDSFTELTLGAVTMF